jgi:EgtB-related family protein
LPSTDSRWQALPLPAPPAAVALPAGPWPLGSADAGFAFDNECGRHAVDRSLQIDAQVLRWAEYLPFVEAGGYDEGRWWTPEGLAWRQSHPRPAPRYLRRDGRLAAMATWPMGRLDRLARLPPDPARSAGLVRLGRPPPAHRSRVGTRGLHAPDGFTWGQVWEWTASRFAPYPGFVPHPYRDYSAPWFDGRPVLRGASFGTQPRMRHPRYRNYFPAERNDIFAGSGPAPLSLARQRSRVATQPCASITANQACGSVQAARGAKAGLAQQRLESPRASTCRSSRCGCARRGEARSPPGQRTVRRLARLQVHLDARLAASSNSATCCHWRKSKSAAQQPVQVAQQVQVEGRRDAQRIVVGCFQQRLGLDQVDADQQRPALARHAPDAAAARPARG